MSTPQQIAQQRLAAGEINLEQFNTIMNNLQPTGFEPQTQSTWSWYDPVGILQMFRWILGIYAGYIVLVTLAVLGSDSSANVYYFYTLQMEGVSSGLGALIIVGLVLELALMVVVLLGFYRYASNVASAGISKPHCSPGWTVGWFFIPVAGFWMPYVALSFQIRASLHGRSWESYTPPAALLIWFVLFWLVNLGGMMLGELSIDAKDDIAAIGFMMSLMTIGSLVCLHVVCTAITRAQSAWLNHTALE